MMVTGDDQAHVVDVPAGHGLYVHVPFCQSRCGYCGFYSSLYEPGAARRFLDWLHKDYARWSGCRPATVYIGGGTPTALSATELRDLLAGLSTHMDMAGVHEFTVEANPASLTPRKADVLAAAGVTRISLGAQSMEERALAVANRCHGTAAIGAALRAARSAGITNLGLDLIAGLPGSSTAHWPRVLEQVVALAPTHLSAYALSIEPDTRFERQVAAGVLVVPDEEDVLDMLDQTEQLLEKLGYPQYEISNYARPGFACQHNLAVWRGGDYLGLGPGASSRLGSHRWTHSSQLDAWEPTDAEELAPATDAAERLMFAFRLNDGVDLDTFTQPFGAAARVLLPAWKATLSQLAEEGHVAFDSGRWRLTRSGRRVADSVAERLLPEG